MTFESRSVRLVSDLFSLAIHPDRPLFSAALASGHVYTYTYDLESGSDPELVWKTRRHKGSCRTAAYSKDGDVLYTAGTDSTIKAASSVTGQVVSKAVVAETSDPVSIILPLSLEHLLLGTDSGTVHLYDLRAPHTFSSIRPAASWAGIHEDYISSLLALPASSTSMTGFSRLFVATGDTSLSYLDVRKPGKALARSENQEVELLCSAYIPNAPSRQRTATEKVLTGTAEGVVTVWTKGFWEDHQDRIPIARATGDSVEALLALPDGFEVPGRSVHTACLAAGAGDGKIRVVQMGQNKILATFAHSYSEDEAKRMVGGKVAKGDYELGLEEGVSALGLDSEGRIISGGGMAVKIWTMKEEEEVVEEVGEDEESDEHEKADRSGKRQIEDSGSDEGSREGDSEGEDSEREQERKKRKRKKRKGGKGKAKSVGVKDVADFKGLD